MSEKHEKRLRLDYKATESWLFSLTKLIWGIFIKLNDVYYMRASNELAAIRKSSNLKE